MHFALENLKEHMNRMFVYVQNYGYSKIIFINYFVKVINHNTKGGLPRLNITDVKLVPTKKPKSWLG